MHGNTGPRIAADIGGTFTDIVLESGDRLFTTKVLTTPPAPEEGAVVGIGTILESGGVAAGDVSLILHGTTLAANAILERKGAVTALITTEGFRDVLEIGYESRYDQYDLMIDKPTPLVPRPRRLTVPERIDVQGRVLVPLDEDAVRDRAATLRSRNVDSVAVGFLHSYANPAHERRVRDILQEELPNVPVSLSCEVCPEVREYERFTTTTVNAYIRPLMEGYLDRLERRLGEMGFSCPILLMTSSGGLTAVETAMRFPVHLIESGPAGGAILAAHVAAELGLDKVISFDMGGTTAKMCLIEGQTPQSAREFEVDRAAHFIKGSGLPLRLPVIEMLEIGAGGGSIARIDEIGKIVVGPESAGADPGPAAYGRGGARPTVTDAEIVLGRIDPVGFAGGQVTLEPKLAASVIARGIGQPLGVTTDLAAYSVCEMVDETMANAARVHAFDRGKVATEHAVIAFGGAAPLHVGRLARKLGVRRIVVPRDAGVGSAIGLLCAPVAYAVVRSRNMRLGDFDPGRANADLDEMEAEARAVVESAAPKDAFEARRGAYMRYLGQGHEIYVPLPRRRLTANDGATIRVAYERAYTRLFSRVIEDGEIEVLTWVVSLSEMREPGQPLATPRRRPAPAATSFREIVDPGDAATIRVPVFRRGDLAPGAVVDGPGLIVEDQTSTLIPEGFTASISAHGHIVIEAREEASQ